MAENAPDWAKSEGVGSEISQAPSWAQSMPQEISGTQQHDRGVFDKLLGLTGPRYQTFPERAVREIAGIPQKTIEAAASAPPGTREATEAMVGPAAEAASLTLAPTARVGRAAVQGIAPEVEELLGGYASAKGTMATPIQPHVLPELKQNILDALHEKNHRDYLSPGTYRAVNELEVVEGKQPTVFDIEGVRRVLGNVPHQERAAASIARSKINDYLSGLRESDLIGGGNVGKTLSEIRGNYAAGKRSEMVTSAEEAGERRAAKTGSGANLDNVLRQNIDKILNNPKMMRGVSEEERKQMESIVKGGKIANIARVLSKLGPKHPITGWFTALAADLKGGMGTALGSLALGTVGQKVAEGSTLSKIRALDEMMRRRSPLYKQQQAPNQSPMIPRLGPLAVRGGVMDLLSNLGSQNGQNN